MTGQKNENDALIERLRELAALGFNLTRPYGERCEKCGTQHLEAGINLANLLRTLDALVSASQDHDGAEGQGEGCRPCCDAHPTQGCADVGCRHDCEGWIERFEERLR